MRNNDIFSPSREAVRVENVLERRNGRKRSIVLTKVSAIGLVLSNYSLLIRDCSGMFMLSGVWSGQVSCEIGQATK